MTILNAALEVDFEIDAECGLFGKPSCDCPHAHKEVGAADGKSKEREDQLLRTREREKEHRNVLNGVEKQVQLRTASSDKIEASFRLGEGVAGIERLAEASQIMGHAEWTADFKRAALEAGQEELMFAQLQSIKNSLKGDLWLLDKLASEIQQGILFAKDEFDAVLNSIRDQGHIAESSAKNLLSTAQTSRVSAAPKSG